MNISDLVIHVHPELSPELRSAVEEFVSSRDGVVAAHFSDKHPHLLNVEYNTDRVRSHDILSDVMSRDPEAKLIGGI